jgi:hypothetical protein
MAGKKPVLGFIAETLAVYRRPGVNLQRADLAFAGRWLADGARMRARNLLRDPSRRLVVPQALYVLAKLSARHSRDTVRAGVTPGLAAAAMFGALQVSPPVMDCRGVITGRNW